MSANEQKTSRELAIIAAQAADEKKATDILVQDVAELVGETDFFVIVTASNSRQVNSIVDAIKEDLRDKGGVKPFHVEGTQDGSWSLLDYGQIVVHVFQPETREYYRLEELWNDAPVLDLAKEAGLCDVEYSDRISKLLPKKYAETWQELDGQAAKSRRERGEQATGVWRDRGKIAPNRLLKRARSCAVSFGIFPIRFSCLQCADRRRAAGFSCFQDLMRQGSFRDTKPKGIRGCEGLVRPYGMAVHRFGA